MPQNCFETFNLKENLLLREADDSVNELYAELSFPV